MAVIGAFKKSGSNDYTGEINALSLQVQNVRIVEDKTASGNKVPTHRIFAGEIEIGAGWAKEASTGRPYLGLKLDDPCLPAPIFANLVADAEGDGFSLMWQRRKGRQASE